MSPEPHHIGATGAEHAATFQQVGVAESYRFRPEYPSELIDLLVGLAGSEEPHSVLDVGCGTGDLARPLASLVDRVDAVDISAAMIEEGRGLPGGDEASLNWIHSPAESADVAPPYSLITGDESIHWMDWPSVFSMFARVLRPAGVVVLVGRVWGTGIDAEMDLIKRSSTYRDYRPRNTVAELEADGLFKKVGSETFGPILWHPTIPEYIAARHSQAGLSREWMGEELVDEFDAKLESLLMGLFPGGRCEIDTSFTVAWGTPFSPVSS